MVAEGRFSSVQRLQAEQACLRTAPVHAVEEQGWIPRQSSADNQESKSGSWRSQSQSWLEAQPRLELISESWRSQSQFSPEVQPRLESKSESWRSQSQSCPEAQPRLESKSGSWRSQSDSWPEARKSWAEHQCDWKDHEVRRTLEADRRSSEPLSQYVTKKGRAAYLKWAWAIWLKIWMGKGVLLSVSSP